MLPSSVDQRFLQDEYLLRQLQGQIASLERRLAQVASDQSRQRPGPPSGGTGTITMGYVTTGASARAANSNTWPSGKFTPTYGAKPTTATDPPSRVATDSGQGSQVFFNWTGGPVPAGVEGLFIKIGSDWYCDGVDCSKVATPSPAPATGGPSSSQNATPVNDQNDPTVVTG